MSWGKINSKMRFIFCLVFTPFLLAHLFAPYSYGERPYEEPNSGPNLIIKNDMIDYGGLLFKDKEAGVCQIYIDRKVVFPKNRKDNIPYGQTFQVRVAPGTHKIAIYWGKTSFILSSCLDQGSQDKEITFLDRDVYLRLYEEKGTILINSLGYLSGGKEIATIKEIEPEKQKSQFKPQSSTKDEVDFDPTQREEDISASHSKNIYCDECGSKNRPKAKFCSACGYALRGDEKRKKKSGTPIKRSSKAVVFVGQITLIDPGTKVVTIENDIGKVMTVSVTQEKLDTLQVLDAVGVIKNGNNELIVAKIPK